MPKILSQSGTSLADIYDVEGSIAGIENLESRDVSLFHEMGGAIHSERLHGFILRISSAAINQSSSWGVEAAGVPDSINRVLGVSVMIGATSAGRVDHCAIYLRDTDGGLEMPIYTWDLADDPEVQAIWSNNGAAAAEFLELRSSVVLLPTLLSRHGDEQNMMSLMFRGTTAAFGGGTVTAFAQIHLLRPNRGNPAPGAPSSYGLPIPGW